jgi:RNA polymerase sigma factor (sigma-70 family)
MTMDPSTNGHDAHLVTAISGGDRGALETVYQDHKDDLLSAAYHLLGDRAAAEDVLQDVFVAFAGKAGDIRLTGRLRGYLVVACLNRARDVLRRRKIEPSATDDLDLHRSGMESPGEVVARLDEAARVAAALAEIPAEQREVCVLKVYGQLTFREIAETLEIPMNTAQSRYRYALVALRRRLLPESAER